MNIVILAAGTGKRMRSALPKVLHPLAGRPLLAHVIETARTLKPTRLVVVIGHGADLVRETVAAPDVQFAVQEQQLGTGHAVQQALPLLDPSVPTLVLYGDVPLTRADTLRALVGRAGQHGYGVLTVTLADPSGYGRIVRDSQGKVSRIVEQKDANADQLLIAEINTGIIVAPTERLAGWLAALKNDNAQGEFYLTDAVEMAIEAGLEVVTTQPQDEWETLGVNSKQQLAELERIHQRNVADALLVSGVTLADPARVDVRGTLECGRDVSIDVNCVFEGRVTLADNVTVGPNCVIRNATIGAGTRVDAFTHIEGAEVGANVVLGPYARLRPGASLHDESLESQSPHVYRRLGYRRASEYRRGHHHVQLRRREQIPHDHRRRRFRRFRHATGCAGACEAGRDDRGGHHGLEGRRGRLAGPERQDANQQDGLRTPD
jgi:bifunctional UDP-N-acetylglucosamine pyrophosphorylase/glucosamine-1-phosphate N-acetyltransferase